MRTTLVLLLTVAVLACGTPACGASKKTAKAVSEYCHICEAASRISVELVGMLAKHPYETRLAAYAAKIADTNTDIFRRLKAPAVAADVKEHFGEAAAAFKKAVTLHLKAEYKASKEAGAKCVQEFFKAAAAVRKLRREGVIP